MMALPQELQFDKYAQQILENSKSVVASTPTITTLSGSEFLNKLSASIFNSIQLQQLQTAANEDPTAASAIKMDFDMAPNHVSIDSSSFAAMDELQKQLDYDKFMNEVWIGIVLTLVLISMVFCICSCFLYHQFRTWKRNYHTNLTNAQALDVESMKLNPEHMEDPVPEYTLVSGLPSYEAALELLHKTPNSCVIVYPSVFSVFNKHEKASNTLQQLTPTLEAATPLMATETLVKSVSQNNNNSDDSIPSYTQATATTTTIHINEKTAVKNCCNDLTATTTTTAAAFESKVPSYDEALLVKTDKC